MTNEIPLLSEELEKLLGRMESDFMSTLVSLSGNLTDISDGILIKIPTDAGYVKLFKSADSLKMSLWLSNQLLTDNLLKKTMEQTQNLENSTISDEPWGKTNTVN